MSKIILAEQASAPDTPGSGKVAIFVDTNGDLAWKDDAGDVIKIASAGAYTLTIPATGTAALRDVAQTFSAAQTFSNALVAPGMKPASNSTTALQLQNAAGTAVLTVDTTNSKVDLAALKIGGVDVPYAVGSWTPTILGTTSNPTVTYTTQTGLYTRIGNLCFAFFSLATSAISGGSDYLKFGGLPISAASAIAYSAITGKITLDSGFSQPGVAPIVSTTTMYLLEEKSATDTGLVPISAWSATSYCSGMLVYRV